MEQRKRVAVIGHTGTIGKHVVEALKLYKDSDGKSQFEIVPAGRRECDISDTKSISCFFQKDGKNLDAVISCAGSQFWGTLDKLDREGLNVGFQNKLGGQIDLAIQALKNLNNNGVVILTSGFLSDVALPGGIGASIVNAGINGFVRCASTETKRGTRIVAISPGFVKESHYPEFIRKGLGEVSAKVLANAYLRAMLVGISGKVLTVTDSGMVES